MLSNIDSMFKRGVDSAIQLFGNYCMLEENEDNFDDKYTIFCEYISKPKHNIIPYGRIPKGLLVIFDVIKNGKYMNRKDKKQFAENFGLEVTPLLWEGEGKDFTEEIRQKLLATPSFLGHQDGYDRIEGIVIKNYEKKYDVGEGHSMFGQFLCSKIVNKNFKEIYNKKNPTGSELSELKDSVRTTARWEKAYQHLNESGKLKSEMRDMKDLISEVMTDLETEELENLKNKLWNIYKKDIMGNSIKGMAEWYKVKIAE